MIKTIRTFAIFLAVLSLTGCETYKSIFGSGIKDVGTTVGERTPALTQEKMIDVDAGLRDYKITVPQASDNKNWPQAGYNDHHLMPNAAIGDSLKIKWKKKIGQGSSGDAKILSRPVMMDGRVFTMDAQGWVEARDMESGDRAWSFDTTPESADGATIGGGVSVDGDTVYASTGFGEVIALSATDGAVKWRSDFIDQPIRAPVTIAGGRVYAVTINNELQVLSAKDGQKLWHHRGITESATVMGASSPAVDGDNVIVTYSSGEIFNLRADNGRVGWGDMLSAPTKVGALPTIADIRGLPVVDGGRVYVISHSGRLGAFDVQSGEQIWEVGIGGLNTPLVMGDVLYVLSNDRQLIALTRDMGRVIWIQNLSKFTKENDPSSTPLYWIGPIMAGGKLWMGNSLGHLIAYAPEDGRRRGDDLELDGGIYIPPTVANGTVYVVTDKAQLYALQ